MEELEGIMHVLAAVISTIVAIMLFPLVKKSLKMKSGLVYEMSWTLLLPGIFIAVFSIIYAVAEMTSGHHELIEALEIVAEICVILASLAILRLAMKIKAYTKMLEG